MGWRMHPTTAVSFDKVFVPSDHLIGGQGRGFKVAMEALDGGRINIAACSVGGAAYCLDTAYNYAHERTQFGQVSHRGALGAALRGAVLRCAWCTSLLPHFTST